MALLKSNTIVYGTANVLSTLTVGAGASNTSTNTSTGSLLVYGGAGITGNLSFGGTSFVPGDYLLLSNNNVALSVTAAANSITSFDLTGIRFAYPNTAPQGVTFKTDGLKNYYIDSTLQRVNEYNLSTAWNSSTSTNTGGVFVVSTQDTNPADIRFKSDGTQMYVLGNTNKRVYQYYLSTPWVVNTATFITNSNSISLLTQDNNTTGLEFSSDGSQMFVCGSGNNNIYQYTLSTPWSVNTATFTASSTVPGFSTILGTVTAIAFNGDGTKLWGVGQGRRNIVEFNLSTPYTITSATTTTQKNIYWDEVSPSGLYYSNTVNIMYMIGTSNRILYQYAQNQAGEIVTNNINLTGNTSANGALHVLGNFKVDNQSVFVSTATFSSTLTGSSTISLTGGSTSGVALGTGVTTGSITVGTNLTTAPFTYGGLTQTSNTLIGRSTLTSNVDIANGITVAGNTKSLNLGILGGGGSTTYINIGPANTAANGLVTFLPQTQVAIQNTITSTSNITGALVVAGGVGVKGNVATDGIIFTDGTRQITAAVGGAAASGYLANSFIIANSAGNLSNTSNLLYFAANDTTYYSGTVTVGQSVIANNFIKSSYPIVAPKTITNQGSGTLSNVAILNTSTYPTGLVTEPTGRFIYLTNFGNNSIVQYTINQTDGSLSNTTITTSGSSSINGPQQALIDYSGRYFYLINYNNPTSSIAQFSINQTTGALTSITTNISTSGIPSYLAIDRTNKFLYVTNQNTAFNSITLFTINPLDGSLSNTTSFTVGSSPIGVAIDPTNRFLYVANSGSNNIGQYLINPSNGYLTSLGTVSTGTTPYYVTVDPTGRFVYVTNQGSNTVGQYSINPNNGTLTSIATDVNGGNTPWHIKVDAAGLYAYETNYYIFGMSNYSGINQFLINQTTGALTKINTYVAHSPVSFVIDPTGRFLYTANFNNNTLVQHIINNFSAGSANVANLTVSTITSSSNLSIGSNNGITAVYVDTSQNVGIGTTSTSAKLSVSLGGVSTLGQQSNQALALLGGGSNNQLCQIGMGYGTGVTYTPTAIGSITTTQTGYTIADLIFATRSVNTDTAPSERMRINSDGRVYSGSASPWTVGSGGVNAWALYNGGDFPLSVASQSTITGIFNRCTSTGTVVEFKYNASPKGTISTDGSTVAYNTSSDYRLKDEVTPMSGALDKVSELKPVTWKWKSTNENGQGFIAHELAEVCPQAVHGTKDEVDADGNPVYQGIDTSFLVATLTAAIQELKAINDTQAETINALTARIEALENK